MKDCSQHCLSSSSSITTKYMRLDTLGKNEIHFGLQFILAYSSRSPKALVSFSQHLEKADRVLNSRDKKGSHFATTHFKETKDLATL